MIILSLFIGYKILMLLLFHTIATIFVIVVILALIVTGVILYRKNKKTD